MRTKIKPVIEVGRNVENGKRFEAWLVSKEYEIDAGRSNHSYVDGENIEYDTEALKIWLEIWAEFCADMEI